MARFGRGYPSHPITSRVLPTGPSTGLATTTDSAPAVDTLTRGVLLLARSVAESAPATDTLTQGVLVMARGLTETAPAVDSLGATAVGKVVSDSAPAVDTLTRGALRMPRTVVESAPALDTVTWRYLRGAVDSAPAVDALTRGALRFARTLAESAPGVDTITVRTMQYARSISDTAAAVDTITVRVLRTPRTVSDSAPATDSLARGALFMARTITNSAPAVDSVGGVVVGSGAPQTTANPNWPLVGFEIDFTSGPPNLPGGSRRSINAVYRRLFVRRWSTSRGRQYELDQVQAGTAALDLPDPLELLNPDNTASPFNSGGDITPYRATWIWAMWPNQPGSGNILNPTVSLDYDPSFETGLSLWEGVNPATVPALSTLQHHGAGTTSMRVPQGGTGINFGVWNSFRVAPDVTYTFSVWVYPTGGANVTVSITDAAGGIHTSNTASAQNTWTRLWVAWDPVDTLETVTIFGAGVANPVFFVDEQQLEFGSHLTDWQANGPALQPIFVGYVERYPTTYDMSGTRAQRPLQAVDALAILSRTTIRQSYELEIAQDSPAAYMPLTNKSAPATAAQLGYGSNAAPNYLIPQSSSIQWGGDAHPDGTSAVTFTEQNAATPPSKSGAGNDTVMTPTGGRLSMATVGSTVEFWARPVVGAMELGFLYVAADTANFPTDYTDAQMGVRIQDSVRFRFIPTSGGASYQYGMPTQTPPVFDVWPDGQWHYYAMTFDAAGNQFNFYDGLQGPNHALSPLPARIGWTIINTLSASVGFGYPQAQFSFGRWAFYNADIGADRRMAHYQRGVGYVGELPGARVVRILGEYWQGSWQVARGSSRSPRITPMTAARSSTSCRRSTSPSAALSTWTGPGCSPRRTGPPGTPPRRRRGRSGRTRPRPSR
ncbi:hypothetical protein [Pseudonocardia sp. T1-2H]|uniref:hypothetical protein n=1 Tax=Pseudonocardia sp. T1-2H TaxID=3128899 RepID=UPI003101679A